MLLNVNDLFHVSSGCFDPSVGLRTTFGVTSAAALMATGAEGRRVLFKSLTLQLCDIQQSPG